MKADRWMGRKIHLMNSGTMEKVRFFCITREHAEDSFESSNRNTDKVMRNFCDKIAQLTTLSKPIKLSRTAYPQFRALNLRHKLDVHS